MSRQSISPHQDPYNVQDDDYIQHPAQQQQHQTQTQRHYLDDIDQIAYDSMSTILEVDSEGTNSETSDRLRNFDSPLHIETPRTPEPRTATLESSTTSNATNDRLSPVSDLSPKDKFSGIISALAEQMERLQPSKPAEASKQKEDARQAQSRPKYGALEDVVDDDATRPPSSDSSNSSSQRSGRSSHQGQQDASTSPLTSESNSRFNSPPESLRPSSPAKLLASRGQSTAATSNVQQQQKAGSSSNLEPESRATSAESLMMITISPMVSPKVKFPILKHAKQSSDGKLYNDENDERKIIEVSNKSTVTAVDLTLMDKMVRKYFVETRDKATQSIKFDCDDEFDTLEFNNRDRSLRRKPGAGNGSRSPQVKSVAVGTEEFSRERFSLLPPTKTRSTQTKSNVDNDIGASETRRFKLAHLDLSTLRQQRSQTKDSSTETDPTAIENESRKSPAKISQEERGEEEENQTVQKTKSKARVTPSPARGSKTPTEDRPIMNEKAQTLNLSHNSLVDLNSKSQLDKISRKKEQTKDSQLSNADLNLESSSPSNSESSDQINQVESMNNSSESLDSLQQIVPNNDREKQQLQSKSQDIVPSKQGPERVKKIESAVQKMSTPHSVAKLSEQSSQSRALIPSVKTELRVIIEIQDSKQRQRSEIMSDSQFIDGKLSKKTRVDTSKHVAATPREVLNRLQTVGRENSLIYQGPKQRLAEGRTPAAVAAAAFQPALHWSSSIHTPQNVGSNNHQSNSSKRDEKYTNSGEKNWREVSKSSVVNEIETKTRQKSDNKLDGIPDNQDSDIIMTSDALISHTANDKSAIELRSRAAQRYESQERDPRTGMLVKTGKLTERTLVESEAGFNDSAAENSNELPSNVNQAEKVRNEEKQQTALEAGRKTPVTTNKLLDNVAEQQRRMKLESEQITSSNQNNHDRRRTPQLSPPRRQQSRVNEREGKGQKPEQWTSQSTPNIRTTSPRFLGFEGEQISASKSVLPIKRQASIEIEEENEDRQQVMENGRLIYDDRLRERKYETQRASSPSLNVRDADLSPPVMKTRESRQFVRSSSMSPRSPILSPSGGILRNRNEGQVITNQPQQRAQLLKPFSLRPNVRNTIDSLQAPILFADQTSNLSASSDPETMDSGFAQSGAGSSSVLNQRANAPSAVSPQYHPVTMMPTTSRLAGMPNTSSPETSRQANERLQSTTRDQSRSSSSYEPRQEQLEEPMSLNFVDDDVDELIDQLDISATTRRPKMSSDSQKQHQQVREVVQSQQKKPPRESKAEQQEYLNSRASSTQLAPPNSPWHDQLISPPPAFRSSEPALNKLPVDTTLPLVKREPNSKSLRPKQNKNVGQETQLTTKLTRTRRQQPGKDRSYQHDQQQEQKQKRHTMTKLEQSVVAPEFRGQDQGDCKVEVRSGKDHFRDHQVKGCRFKAQVMFESDTDSMSVSERQSGASQSSRCSSSNANILNNTTSKRARKELVSETKYSSTQLNSNAPEVGSKQATKQQSGNSSMTQGVNSPRDTNQRAVGSRPDFIEPSWDYSLRVNRMRGTKVDSKVNTLTKKSSRMECLEQNIKMIEDDLDNLDYTINMRQFC